MQRSTILPPELHGPADRGLGCLLAIEATDLEGLFSSTALALRELAVSEGEVLARECRHVDLSARSLDRLFRRWVEEIVALQAHGELLLARVQIRLVRTHRVRAVLWGEPFQPRHHRLRPTLPLALPNLIEIDRRQGIWTARID